MSFLVDHLGAIIGGAISYVIGYYAGRATR